MIRVGQGYDVHKFVSDRHLVIGGVNIPFEFGLEGHSDADVLIHAIIDALLGAGGKGDIGHHFSDTDAQFKDVDSRELLRKVWNGLKIEGYTIGNIDATIVAENPKMALYLEKMKENIAYDCQTSIQHVNVKATTSETMGFIGRNEGIAAMAICLLEKQDNKPSPL